MFEDATALGSRVIGRSEEAVERAGGGGPGAGAATSVVPHIPQKRFKRGFSFPQRGQRTCNPFSLQPLLYSLRQLSTYGTLLSACINIAEANNPNEPLKATSL